ncbi:MAG: BolA family transcriptional regulator [Magnetovibrio sp.]|nr:BolA family transcriptional regulator [Magnetovibrio sp.]|tara:strand:+ start:190 stop:525 length:336 start_codon:yes stop_codon:yes gene_type:complete
MTIEEQIRTKIEEALHPKHLEILNESHMHNVPSDSETHFKLVIVTDQFDGKSRIERHKIINNLLALELSSQVHALSLLTLTTPEWDSNNKKIQPSPKCLGGQKTGLSTKAH